MSAERSATASAAVPVLPAAPWRQRPHPPARSKGWHHPPRGPTPGGYGRGLRGYQRRFPRAAGYPWKWKDDAAPVMRQWGWNRPEENAKARRAAERNSNARG